MPKLLNNCVTPSLRTCPCVVTIKQRLLGPSVCVCHVAGLGENLLFSYETFVSFNYKIINFSINLTRARLALAWPRAPDCLY